MDLNKRLPLLPGDGFETELTKTQHITRLMKSLKKSNKTEDGAELTRLRQRMLHEDRIRASSRHRSY